MPNDDLLIERLLRVIDEGRRTATYKLALVHGIIDVVATRPGDVDLPTRVIAERVLELCYPQTRTYVDRDGLSHEPRQISMKSSPVLAAAARLRALGDVLSCRNLVEIAQRAPDEYSATLDVVEETFVRYPIPLLQTVGTTVVPFLYEVDWPQGTPIRTLRRRSGDHIRLLDGVAERLVALGPMLRPLIEHHWTQDVARWSRIGTEDARLHAHLFGHDRSKHPPDLVRGLRDLQRDECFYCGARLDGRVEVDHFLAWSRWPNDAIENLVLADRRCNGAKSDHLAAFPHLRRWRDRLQYAHDDLCAIADSARWMSAGPRSLALVQSTYQNLAPGTPLWRRDREFELAAGPSWL